jgi:hypothetical protein
MKNYIKRIIDDELEELFEQLPAISIEGPKGVGKTETARRWADVVFELDDPSQREIIEADPSIVSEEKGLVLIDEWQYVPETWDIVRRAVDQNSSARQFLLTGSATPTEFPTHSGAGRIVTLRLRPFSLAERGLISPTVSLRELLNGEAKIGIEGKTEIELKDYVDEILKSGFPGIRNYTGRSLREQLRSYATRIVDTDFPQMDHPLRKPKTLMRWMTAYAAATSTTASYETIRDAATSNKNNKPAKTTTIPYREVLEKLWILEPLPAWLPSRNQFSRLSKPPKHQLADPALAAQLLKVNIKGLLTGKEFGPPIPRDGTLLGKLFESLVCQSVRVYAQACEAMVGHLRTKGGRHEVDLIVERGSGKIVAFEVKLGRTVESKDVKHLLWLKEKMGDDLLDAGVIHTGPRAYRRKDGIAVIPAALLAP